MRFAVVPEVPVLVNGWLCPEISCRDDVFFDWEGATLFSAEYKNKVGLSRASDKLRELRSGKSKGAWLSSVDVDELRLEINQFVRQAILIRFWVLTPMSFDLLIWINYIYKVINSNPVFQKIHFQIHAILSQRNSSQSQDSHRKFYVKEEGKIERVWFESTPLIV